MNVLFDINVVLDSVGNRLPFYGDSHAALLKAVEIGATPMFAVHAFPFSERKSRNGEETNSSARWMTLGESGWQRKF